MSALDWFMVAGLGLSALVGVLRGAAYELISLGGWVAAFVVARQLSPWLGEQYLHGIASPSLRHGVAWVVCFVIVILAAGLLATIMRLLLRSTGLGVLDRSMGGLFGLLRGIVLLLLAVLAARYTDLPQTPMWKTSLLLQPASVAASQILPLLPSMTPQALPRQQ